MTCLLLLVSSTANAQNISIGLYDNISTLYLTANQDYQVIEDLSENPLPSEVPVHQITGKMLDLAFSNFRSNKLKASQKPPVSSVNNEFTDSRTLVKKNAWDKALLRSSPATANPLLIAAEPDLVTSSRKVKFECMETPCLFRIKTPGQESRTYRGSIIIKPFKDNFTVINYLDIEDYLKGVVPSEMPSSWHLEALKAQSIAARTYSMAMLGRRKALGYDLKSTVEDQMYIGYLKEDPLTSAAIKATQGELLITNQGLYVDAYFSSHAGFYTNTPEGAWGLSPKGYLMPAREVMNSTWQIQLSKQELENKLQDLQLNPIKAITILNRSLEGRVAQILISGTEKHALLIGEEFRHKLGLRSTNFDIIYSSNSITISGSGYGHGIGMSQHGAKYLAEHGRTYEEILGHYYKRASLLKL